MYSNTMSSDDDNDSIMDMLEEMEGLDMDDDTEEFDPHQQIKEISCGFAEKAIKELFNTLYPNDNYFTKIPEGAITCDFTRDDDVYKLRLDVVPCDHTIEFGNINPNAVIKEIEQVLFRAVADAYPHVIKGSPYENVELRKEIQTATFYAHYNDQYRIGCVLEHVT